MHVYCNYHEIREQDATEKSYPKISVPRTKDADFAHFYHSLRNYAHACSL